MPASALTAPRPAPLRTAPPPKRPLRVVPRLDVWVVCPRCAGPAHVVSRGVFCTSCTWSAEGGRSGHWCPCCWAGGHPPGLALPLVRAP